MKHMCGLLLLIGMISALGAMDYRVAGGLDLMGEGVGSESAFLVGIKHNTGVSFSGQAIKTTNNVNYGFGMDLQLSRKHQSMPEGFSTDVSSAAYVPIYGILGYAFPEYQGFAPEFIGQLGYSIPFYNFNDVEINSHYSHKYEAEGGVFTGFGIGMRHQDIDLQLLYRVNRSTLNAKEYYDNELDYTYHGSYDTRQWNLSIGYRFSNPIK